MSSLNGMDKDAIFFLEENGFSNQVTHYYKTIIVDSKTVLVSVLYIAERSSYDSDYSITTSVWPRTPREKRLDTFDINVCLFDICIFKKLMSNIDLLCKKSMDEDTVCFYNMEFNSKLFYASCCNKYLQEELYK